MEHVQCIQVCVMCSALPLLTHQVLDGNLAQREEEAAEPGRRHSIAGVCMSCC